MSDSIRAYVVRLDELGRVIGSENQVLADEITSRQADEISELNEVFADDIEDGSPSAEEALVQLINGDPLPDDVGMHWYVVEMLANHLGRQVSASGLEDTSYTYLMSVDQFLIHSLSIPPALVLTSLFDKGVSLELPPPDGEPAVGVLTAEDSETVARLARGIDADDLDGDPDVLEGVRGYLDIVDDAVRAKTDALLFFA